ncbi:hypothetical protein N8083_01245 [Candidatus Pacebacteria bacterium]|nr:hypothetical protein [Candidatus Paceibacterota bacterium]
MSRESLILLLGIIIFFTPSLGIPEAWKVYIFSGAGILLIVIGYMLRRAAYLRSIDLSNGGRATDSFVESANKEDTEVTVENKV